MMAYATGIATSATDLLDKLKGFTEANGWTTNLYTAEDAGQRLHIQKGTIYVNFKSAVGEDIFPNALAASAPAKHGIGIVGSTGYDPALAWHSQPGASVDTLDRPCGAAIQQDPPGTNIEYHLFAFTDPDFVFCTMTYGGIQASSTNNTYEHIVFGNITKVGVWTGGAFIAASKPGYYMADGIEASQTRLFSQEKYSTMFLKADIDIFNRWLCNSETQVSAEYGNTDKRVYSMVKGHKDGLTAYNLPTLDFFQSKNSATQGMSCNVMNALSIMFPIYVFAQRDPNAENIFSTLGTIPWVYLCNMKHLTPGRTYRLNYVDGNEYKVFPFSKKGGALGYDGIAVRYMP